MQSIISFHVKISKYFTQYNFYQQISLDHVGIYVYDYFR